MMRENVAMLETVAVRARDSCGTRSEVLFGFVIVLGTGATSVSTKGSGIRNQRRSDTHKLGLSGYYYEYVECENGDVGWA